MSKWTDVALAIFMFSNLIRLYSGDQWLHSFCQDSVCLYFNGTQVRRQSNEVADLACSQYGLQLLEIPSEKMQGIVDAATSSWDNYARPLIGFYFRINLNQLVGSWTWLSSGEPFESQFMTPNRPYFGIYSKNSSGSSYHPDHEKNKYFSLCSHGGSCKSDNDTIYDAESSSCIVIVNILKSWFDSRSNCQYLGGDLVAIKPSSAWVSKIPVGDYWIGLTKARYVWQSTGEFTNYHRWKNGEPLEGYDCTSITHTDHRGPNYWAKHPCHGDYPFMCMNSTAVITVSTSTSTTTTTQQRPSISSVPNSLASSTEFALPKVTNATLSVGSKSTSPASTQMNDSTSGTGVELTSHTRSPTTSSPGQAPSTAVSHGMIAGFAALGGILIVLILSAIFFVVSRKMKKNHSKSLYNDEIPDQRSTIVETLPDDQRYEEIRPQPYYDEINDPPIGDKTYVEAGSVHYDVAIETPVSKVTLIPENVYEQPTVT